MIKHINQSLVLHTIRREEPISRAQISKKLNLSRSTVSQIVDVLIEKEMIFEKGMEASASGAGGRPGQMLWFNPVSSYVIGLDLTGQDARLCIADLAGNPAFVKTYPSGRDAEEAAALVAASLRESGIDGAKVSRLSVSVPGIVNDAGLVLRATRLRWRNYDLKGHLSGRFDFPIDVHNDVNLALVGERFFGTGKNCSDLIYLSLGKGIGCGIMAAGQMVRGSGFMAGEISHYVSDMEHTGPQWEQPLERRIGHDRFTGFQGGFSEAIEGFSRGDPACCEVMEDFINTLSLVIANAISLLNPDKIIIGGEMSEHMDPLLDAIRETVARVTPIRVEISLAKLRADSCMMGAVAYALEQINQE